MENLIYAINCKKCNKLLFGTTSLEDGKPDGPMGIVGNPEFQQTVEGNYFVCPHCMAKNITVNIGGQPSKMKITHAI